MRKPINREEINGRIYDHNLALKTVQKKDSENFGKEFINGTLDIATDDDGLNIVTVHFTYVTAVTSKNTANATFAALKKIIDGQCKTVVNDGFEAANFIKITPSIGLNDFYTNRGEEEDVLVSAKRNEGGFVTFVSKLNDPAKRSTFECDMLITETRVVEANEERGIDNDYLVLKGFIFDFREAILPVEFSVKTAGGMKYFESLGIEKTNPVFTKVWGNIESQNIVTRREEENAFGEPAVKEFTRTIREYIVTGCAKEPYEIGDEKNGITVDEVNKRLENREIYLADVKKRQEEYQASKNNATTATTSTAAAATTSAAAGGFNF